MFTQEHFCSRWDLSKKIFKFFPEKGIVIHCSSSARSWIRARAATAASCLGLNTSTFGFKSAVGVSACASQPGRSLAQEGTSAERAFKHALCCLELNCGDDSVLPRIGFVYYRQWPTPTILIFGLYNYNISNVWLKFGRFVCQGCAAPLKLLNILSVTVSRDCSCSSWGI